MSTTQVSDAVMGMDVMVSCRLEHTRPCKAQAEEQR